MGVVGCILGFLVVIYLCYKDWSVYIASIVGAAVVIAALAGVLVVRSRKKTSPAERKTGKGED